MSKPTPEQIASRLGVTMESVKLQFARNAEQLRGMYGRAITTGKKVNGYTAGQLLKHAKRVEAASK